MWHASLEDNNIQIIYRRVLSQSHSSARSEAPWCSSCSQYSYPKSTSASLCRGTYWTSVRSAVLPLFHSHKLQKYGEAMNSCCQTLVDILRQKAGTGAPVEILESIQVRSVSLFLSLQLKKDLSNASQCQLIFLYLHFMVVLKKGIRSKATCVLSCLWTPSAMTFVTALFDGGIIHL